jgi:uncharacterized protein YbcC (UPF0753/DUF2309 family)
MTQIHAFNATERTRTPEARQAQEVSAWVRQALDVVAPQWPLPVFVARHPWPNLEHMSFADAMALLQGLQAVDLYPSSSVLRSALQQGEICRYTLDQRLAAWLDVHLHPALRPRLDTVCRALLWWEDDAAPSDVPPRIWRWAAQVVAAGEAPSCPPAPRLRSAGRPRVAQRLEQQTIRWCKLYLDAGQAAWRLPGRADGLYAAWRRLAAYDPALTRAERKRLADWPAAGAEAIRLALQRLGVAGDEVVTYLRAHLAALPGWAGILYWQGREQGDEVQRITDYLAVRLSLEWALCGPDHPPVGGGETGRPVNVALTLAALARHGGMTATMWWALPPALRKAALATLDRFRRVDRWQLWLEAWEDTFAERLASTLREPTGPQTEAPLAQLLFCIDVRSEGLRRRLEAAGPFETYGCAGFYNLPMKTRDFDSPYAHPSCPPMVAPQVEVRETAADSAVTAYRRRQNAARFVADVFTKAKQHILAALALPELSGPWLGLYALLRTLAPRVAGRLLHRLERATPRRLQTRLLLDRGEAGAAAGESDGLPTGWTVAEMAEIAGGLLRSIGLTAFAPLVVVCGHEGRSTNNPHAAALDCGACGGAAGRWNARVFAAICNRTDVRAELAARHDIHIPADTVFIAAEHITTTDEMEWLDVPLLSHSADAAWRALQAAVGQARRETAAERLQALPDPWPIRDPSRAAERRAGDWSEVRPEWGLAGNRAFIIGRRVLTRETAWSGRVFLHSYDWRLDPDGDQLAAIVAGPVTVAQWINLQYYVSTVAPDVYGSGSKATQTVTGGIGVMQGNGSDLLAGLPWQSVAADDRTLYHAPLRLWVVVEAPENVIERLLARDPVFRRKVEGGWLRFASVDPITGQWRDWSSPGPAWQQVVVRGPSRAAARS